MKETVVNVGAFILEDDVEMHDLMMDMIRESGMASKVDIHITDNTDVFMSKINSDINIVVLDHLLTGNITGLDIIKKVKEKNKWSYVIIMSGQGKLEVALKYLNAGANRYINKNWKREEIKEIINDPSVKDKDLNYIHVLVKYLKEGFEEAKERIKIVKFLESKIRNND